MPQTVKIGLIAGEASGDQLGGPLIPALRRHFPNAEFTGIGGPLMQEQQLHSLFPMERLAVMGFVDPLKRLPELLRIRKQLFHHFRDNEYDLVIGIDAPDFNLGLELKLRREGIKTAHYVSPSVWAWRQRRIKKIAGAVDHMLTLFPFEIAFYDQHRVPATFVGHPLADQFPLQPDTATARAELDLTGEGCVVALLPGSRRGEVAMLGQLFLQAAERIREQKPNAVFVLPAASPERRVQLEVLLREFPGLPVTLLDGRSHQAMTAADVVMMASGTIALEAMLLKKPMVVSYRMGAATFTILRKLVTLEHVSLPNLLAGRELVKELLQEEATVDAISQEVLALLADEERRSQLQDEFTRLHQQLRQDASETAAQTLASLVASG